MPSARRNASVMSQSDVSKQLYTLVNGMTGDVDGRSRKPSGGAITERSS